jgi:Ribosomal protein L41
MTFLTKCADLQRIVKDGETLGFGSLSGVVSENETVVLLLDLAGGMRAKWRKKRMRRLRRKRRKMRQRAR